MFRLPLLVALLAAIGMIGVACGGSDSSATPTATTVTTSASATEAAASRESLYFTKVAAIFSTGQTGSAAATDTLNAGLDATQTVDEKKAVISNFLDTMVIVFERATNDMSALNPPPAAKAAHDQFSSDIETAKQKSSNLKGQLGAITSDDALNAIVDQFNTEIDPLVTDSNSACRSLQTLANSDGITVDLSCGS